MNIKSGNGQTNNLKVRTKQFALRIISLYSSLPRNPTAQVVGKQLLRSGTSVGAQYREGCRSRSEAEFVSKLEVALQELEETIYWMELLIESEIIAQERIDELMGEADELMAMLTSSVKTVKMKKKKK